MKTADHPLSADFDDSDIVRAEDVFVFSGGASSYLFLVNGSQIFHIDEDVAAEFRHFIDSKNSGEVNALFRKYGLNTRALIDDKPPDSLPIRSLSLAIAQKCNLGCSYCYAQEGNFGGPAKNMTTEIAMASVERLIGGAGPGERVNLAFMGGEPLINRQLLRDATRYATGLATERDVRIGFSVTTNGTLLSPQDGEFFEEHGFAVTISLDGIGSDHDQLRPFKSGRGSFDHIMQRIDPLLRMQHRMQVSARVTVTPRNLDLLDTLQSLIDKGFHSVGFSPMLAAPNGKEEMSKADLQRMLAEMIKCGERLEQSILHGRRFPFSNAINALREIHLGTHRPYPCGAGAGYLGVSADGDLAACHRFVGNPKGAMGNIRSGLDAQARQRWLSERHVHRQQPCNQCWARYLCGGGCHHEVIERGRPACDYIRGWLAYCLKAYARLIDTRPDYFNPAVASSSN